MKKRLLGLGLSVMFMFGITGYESLAKEAFVSLNPVIDVGEKIYVQHDENNNDSYEMYKSGDETTRVYEVIIPNFTAGKAWTKEGQYMDNIASAPHGATAPEDYIPVVEKEQYFIRTYGVGWTEGLIDGEKKVVWYTPVLFMDENDNVISHELTNTVSKSKAGVFITVPENAVKMHLTMFNHQSFSLQKALDLTEEEFDNLPIHKNELKDEVGEKYQAYQKDKTVYKKPDKGYITFVNDDTWGSIEEWAEIFKEKDVPLVLATIPELLIENATSQTQTRLDIARQVEAAGGEILAHNAGVLTQEGFADYDTMYSFFVRTKQLFNYYDFDVNGIILAGGQGQVAGAKESEEWASSIYSYSDLYGVEYDKKEIALDSAFYHRRSGLGNYSNNLERMKQEVDNAINNNSWLVYYFHNSNEIDPTVLEQLLDYVNSKSEEELEVVTYREMYEKNAVKESELINNKHTYYVSSTGTSELGVAESNPMSYETAKSKSYVSGDTILFKCDDTFYGTFDPEIAHVNDEVTTISSYGEGEMPTISGYKIVDTETAWQDHGDGLYKVYLMNSENFKGVSTADTYTNNIGFMEDSKGKKYFNKKSCLSALENEYDFYCDGEYLYLKTNENPYKKLGELKLATRTNLLILESDLKIENIRLEGTGAHGMVGSDITTENVEIANNVIEDIGGSYLSGTTRYGNGIEFYSTDAVDIMVRDNIIRNIYDVGFTMQGTRGSAKNVVVRDNVFVENSQDSEIWQSGTATGIESYEFTRNTSINCGRGWGYEARPEKYASAHILFWQYLLENTDIYFHHNKVYNPRRVYFIEQSTGTNVFFQENDYIKSDYNKYFLTEDTNIFRDSYKITEKNEFIKEFKKDMNSIFSVIEEDKKLTDIARTSNNIHEINQIVGVKTGDDMLTEPDPTRLPTPIPTPTKEPEQEIIPTPAESIAVTKIPEPTKSEGITEIPELTGETVLSPVPTKELEVSVTPVLTEEVKITVGPTPTKEAEAKETPIPTKSIDITVSPIPTKTGKVTVSPIPTKTGKVTVSPIPTKTGKVTVSPIPTKAEKVTVSPVPTKEAKVTVSPTPTKEAKVTVSPTPTKEAKVSASPLPTKEAKVSASPVPTKEVKVSASPLPTKEAKVSASPIPTKEAKVSASPVPTKVAEKTGTPVPTKPMSNTPTIMPTEAAEVTENLRPTKTEQAVTEQPEATPQISEDEKEPEMESPSEEFPEKGTELIEKKTRAVYVVTKAGKKGGTVTYDRPASKDITVVTIPKTVTIDGITYKVTAIAPKAFKNCKKLKKAVIKNNVVVIGKESFFGCKSLKTVRMGTKVTTIGSKAFYKCTSLIKIIIPSSVKSIGKQAFSGCEKLEDIIIKTNKLTIKTVGSKSFRGIHENAFIKVPKKCEAEYRKLLKDRGIGSKVVVKD